MRRIREACKDGKGYSAMAKRLNAEKVPTVTGAKWSHKTVRVIALRSSDKLVVVDPEPITEPLQWVTQKAVSA